MTNAKKLSSGTYIILAHRCSQPTRLELVSLALQAAKQETQDHAHRTGKQRPGPKGNEVTHLAQRLGVHQRTVWTWIKGEEPGDVSTSKLLGFLQLHDGPIARRVGSLVERDLHQHHQAASEFLGDLNMGTYFIHDDIKPPTKKEVSAK